MIKLILKLIFYLSLFISVQHITNLFLKCFLICMLHFFQNFHGMFLVLFFALITLEFCFLMLKLGPHSVHVINFKFLTIQIWCAIAYHWLSAYDFRGGGLNEYYSNTYYEFQKNPFTFRKMLFVENFHWNFNAMLRKRIDLVLFYISF